MQSNEVSFTTQVHGGAEACRRLEDAANSIRLYGERHNSEELVAAAGEILAAVKALASPVGANPATPHLPFTQSR